MFELLVNLMLTSLFLKNQADQQATIENLTNAEYRLTPAETRILAETAPQKNPETESLGVEVSAKSVIVADAETGKVLYNKNSSEVRPIASITKLMTALVFLDNNPGWEKEVKISSSHYREGGIAYVIAGEVISARDLFYTSLIASSNEATVALASATGLSDDDFVKKMNEKAKALGMNQTSFVDVTGLNSGNKSTAADLVLLIKSAFNDYDIKRAISAESHDINIINKKIARKIKSTDQILNKEFGVSDQSYRVLGGKTGFLELAGYCFASKIADNSGRNIFTVVLGSSTINSRFIDTKSLAYWVFNNYNWSNL